ncbi:endoplasmic reticulum membrane-associated RNA degradation protein-like isoform X1 [Palaemon carinicauda]|uniref:endoplasmic reticulum membrane-associated RNA degradation protein-like isoform X1 n=1 Tax=Palaemon carinicauda TaxID=392227 RepID=UPI0035B68C0B
MMSLSQIKSQPTFLSADVKNLLETFENFSGNFTKTREYWFTSGLTIDWKNVDCAFDDIQELQGSKGWFKEAVQVIAPFMSYCDMDIRSLSIEDYITDLQPYLRWTYQEDVVLDCFKLVSSQKSEGDYLLALLMITSVAERAFGNLLLTRSKQVPFLLRDLLVSLEDNELLGKPKSQLLVLLFGNVYGLNLRNIAWHGFLNPKEAKSSFVTTIILFLVNVGQDLEVNLMPGKCIPERLQTSLPETEDLFHEFMRIPCANRDSMEEIIYQSPLVPDVMMPVWTKILDLLEEKRYGLCLILLLPMLECSMRCLFALANEETSRILTADNSSFYTTLDEILQLYYEKGDSFMQDLNARRNPDGECIADSHNCRIRIFFENILVNSEPENTTCCKTMRVNLVPFVIGEKLNEALHDMLNFMSGPRVRDRLSHGEIKLDHVSEDIAYHMICISLLVLSIEHWRGEKEAVNEYRFLCKVNNDLAVTPHLKLDIFSHHSCNTKSIYQSLLAFNISKISSPTETLIQLMKSHIMEYQCAYHPRAVLHEKLISCILKLEKWSEWDRVSCSEIQYPDWETGCLLEMPVYFCFPPLTGFKYETHRLPEIINFKLHVKSTKYTVLYRSKVEIELISLCNRIICCAQLALDNIKDNLSVKYSQYVNKTLRSRQRSTYRRQLAAVPTIILNFYTTCQLIFAILLIADDLLCAGTSLTNVMKTLKKILKLHENIVSNTNLNMNRWDEALKNSTDNITNIKMEYSK